MVEPLGTIRQLYGWDTPFGIDLTKRTAIFGATGSGKSTLLQRIIAGLITKGAGFTLQDPHGELADWTLSMIPKSRLQDTILLAPSFDARSFAQINPLRGTQPHKRAKDT